MRSNEREGYCPECPLKDVTLLLTQRTRFLGLPSEHNHPSLQNSTTTALEPRRPGPEMSPLPPPHTPHTHHPSLQHPATKLQLYNPAARPLDAPPPSSAHLLPPVTSQPAPGNQCSPAPGPRCSLPLNAPPPPLPSDTTRRIVHIRPGGADAPYHVDKDRDDAWQFDLAYAAGAFQLTFERFV